MGTLIGGHLNPVGFPLEAYYDFSNTATLFNATSGGSTPSPGGAINRIEDLSGNGRHLVQATSGECPILSAASINGLATGFFNGGQGLQHSTASTWRFLHNGTKVLSVVVAKLGVASDPNAAYVIGGTNTIATGNIGYTLSYDDRASVPRNNRIGNIVGRGVSAQPAINNMTADDAVTPNVFHTISLITDPTNGTPANRSLIYVDTGSAIANNTGNYGVSAADPVGPFTIGRSPTGLFPLVGNIAAWVILSGANATEANRTALLQYFKARFAI